MQQKFYDWMRHTEGKTHNTAYAYKNSINKISSYHSQKTGKFTDIYSIEDLSILSDIASDYSQTGRFATYGFEGNATIRNAIATYVRFYEHYSKNGNTNIVHQQTVTIPIIRRKKINGDHSNSCIKSTKNSRYKGNAIGNSQNLFIRNILSNLGAETFSESDWNETKRYFGHKCAYCGEEKNLIMEHAIPINKENLGEHRLGNLVPSCKECNDSKHYKHFKEFLADQPVRLGKINNYMKDKMYTSLDDNENSEAITEILNMAHEEIGRLAQRYIVMINKLM